MLVFLIDFKPYISIEWTTIDSSITFFEEFSHSLREYDVIYLLFFAFIYYFYLSVYFKENNDKKYCKLCIIFSIIFTFITIIGKSYIIDNTLNNLYLSSVQIVKTIIYILGYYLAYYAITKKIVSFKFSFSKKKTI